MPLVPRGLRGRGIWKKEGDSVRGAEGRGNSAAKDMQDVPYDTHDLAWLGRLARGLLGETHAAEDLVQDTTLAALRTGVPDDANPRAWLGSVARRLAARRFRGEARRTWREALVARSEALPDSAELADRAEVAEKLVAAARSLEEPYRRTILLHFLEGRSPLEIARSQGVPVDTVRWRSRRGLELLREDLLRQHGGSWSSWSALLLPLTHLGGGGLAATGTSGAVAVSIVPWILMKTVMVGALTLGCLGVWLAWTPEQELEPGLERTRTEQGVSSGGGETLQVAQGSSLRQSETGEEPARAQPPARTVDVEDAVPRVVETGVLRGEVVDKKGTRVPGATVYLASRLEDGAHSPVSVLVESDRQGAFALDTTSLLDGRLDGPLDLGVVANGFLRKFVPDVLETGAPRPIRVVLERGLSLSGRVVDRAGRPVSGLKLVACTASVGVDHVSPSQRLLRAKRAAMQAASGSYEHCVDVTDGAGQVVFRGLRDERLTVLPLDPGWTIESPRSVEAGPSPVEWVAHRQLGVRLLVSDGTTGSPLAKSSATFGVAVVFANGDKEDLSQWVGNGSGEVSFVLDPAMLPGLEARVIDRATFYGTVRAEGYKQVEWRAAPIEAPVGGMESAVGVVDVRVGLDERSFLADPEDASGSSGARRDPGAVGRAVLQLDVRYDDGAPFEGDLEVSFVPVADSSESDSDMAERVSTGNYRIEVPAVELLMDVSDRQSLGSLRGWKTEVRLEPGETKRLFPVLPRGGSAVIPRPNDWAGEWFVRASWRPSDSGSRAGSDEWRGGWVVSTAQKALTLSVLRPAQWRFELRQNSMFERDPIVRTVVVESGAVVTAYD